MSQYQQLVEGTALPSIETITGDTGGAVGPDAAFNINLQASSPGYFNGIEFTGVPGSNLITAKDLRTMNKYVVDNNIGETEYFTIQSALDSALAAGLPAIVYVRPGTYTQNLTLYDNIIIVGDSLENTTIVGVHSVSGPSSGKVGFYNLSLHSATDIISTATTGAASEIVFESCKFDCTDGYIFDLFSWSGTLTIRNCYDISTTNGILLNPSGSAALSIYDSAIGAGTSKSATPRNDLLTVRNSTIGCPVSISIGTSSLSGKNSIFADTITISASALASELINSSLATGANSSINHTGAQSLTLSDVTIDSSNTDAIAGTGTVVFGSVTFLNSSGIAATIAQTLTPILKTGEIHAENIQNIALSGFLSWGGAGNYYSVAGNVVTVLRPGNGYIKSKLMSWLGGQSTGALAAGSTYYIYMDSTGTIGTTSTRTTPLFKDNVILFEALVDNSGVPNVVVVKENHPYTFPVESSEWAHDTIGPVIANKNNGANITLNGTKGIQINGADELEDHGLETDIPDSGGAAVTFSFMYTDAGGKWIRNTTANTFPSDYNNAGVIAALGANKYGIFRLYVSKDDINSSVPTYYAVYDDQQYNNLTAANTAIALGTPATATAELAQLELAQLGFVVKEQSSDTIVNVVIEKETARTSFTGASSNQASLIITDTTNFDGWLSVADTTAQAALETLDDQGKNVTPQYSVLVADSGFDISSIPVGTTGQLLVGSTGANPAFAASANADFNFTTSTAGATRTLEVSNSNNSNTASHAEMLVESGGSSGGDPFLHLNILGEAEISFGLDNTDGNALKMTNATGPSAGTLLWRMSSAGEIKMPLQPAFLASLTGGNETDVTGDASIHFLGSSVSLTEIYDQGGDFNVNGTFTAPITGRYLLATIINLRDLTASHVFGSVSLETSNRIHVDAVSNYGAARETSTGNNTLSQNVAHYCDMDAGDTAKARIQVTGGTKVVDIGSNSPNIDSGFSGALIC